VVDFQVRKLRAFIGKFHYINQGKSAFAKYLGLELMMDGNPKQFILGEEGDFYLENIAADKYEARIFDQHHECHFVMTIPDSEEIMVDMGDMSCDLSKLHSNSSGDHEYSQESLLKSDIVSPDEQDMSVMRTNSSDEHKGSKDDLLTTSIILHNSNDIPINTGDIQVNYEINMGTENKAAPMRHGAVDAVPVRKH